MTKFEKDFEEYILGGYPENEVLSFLMCVRGAPETGDELILKAFKYAPDSMKWGVYVDFFDSVGIAVGVIAKYDGYVHWIKPSSLDRPMMFSSILPINDARKASLEKAIEIYNQ